jgi:predicted N-acyltransferase
LLMRLTVTLYSSISEIDQAQWDNMAGQPHAMLRHRWLSHLENGSLNKFEPQYIVARDPVGQVVAHAAAYVSRTSLLIFSSGLLRTAVDVVRKVLPNFMMVRILECGMPVGLGDPVCVLGDIDPEQARWAILDGLEKLSASQRVRLIVIRDLADDAAHLKRLTALRGYSMVPHLPNAILRIRWKSLDEYASDMRSPYRFRLRKRLRAAAKAGLRCEISPISEVDPEWVLQQIRNVDAAAAEFQRNVLQVRFFERIQETGTEWVCFTVFRQHNRVAVALVLVDGPTARWTFFGRENPGAHDGAYFLVIAEIVRFAIQRELQAVEMGLTTYRAKLEFGAQLERFEMAVRIRLPGGQGIVNLLKRLNKVMEVTDKDVFRTSTSIAVDQADAL